MSAAVGGYRVVVRLPGVLPAFAWAGLARLGYGVLPLALLLLLSARRGSFAEAAAATTAYGLAAALLGPARARAADRFGAARALPVFGVLLVVGASRSWRCPWSRCRSSCSSLQRPVPRRRRSVR